MKLFTPPLSLFKLFLIVFGLFNFFYSCKKKEENFRDKGTFTFNFKNGISDYAITTTDVWEENGYLAFKDYETYTNVINSLQDLTSNDDFFNNAIIELGFDPFDESDDDFESENPVLQLFENRFPSFNSLRLQQEMAELNFLEGEGNTPEDFVEHFWVDPYLRTVVNENLEIKIGDYFIKQFDEYKAVVISSLDNEKLNYVRSKGFNEIVDQENLIKYNYLNQNDRILFEDGIPKNPDCVARFKVEFINSYGGRHYYQVTSTSFNVGSTTDYTWNFGGGLNALNAGTYTQTGSNGANPGVISFASNGYPYTLTLALSHPTSSCSSSFSYQIPNPTNCYGHFTVSDDPDNGNRLFFDVTTSLGFPLQFDWSFGDNTGIVNGGPNVNHTYFTSGTYNVTLSTSFGACISVETQSVYGGCGRTGNYQAFDRRYDNQSKQMRYVLKLTNNLWHHSICARSTNYKNNYSGWKKHKADVLKAGWSGTFFLKQTVNGNCLLYNHGSSSTVNNRKSTEYTYVSSNHIWSVSLFVRDNEISSSHYAEDNGFNSGYQQILFGQ